jgi:Cd2+/Zn2+-exporting ATPase
VRNDKSPLQIDLSLILPGAPDEADACIGRLIEDLTGRMGVDRVHVVSAATPNQPAKICIHYDESILSLSRVREIVHSVGATLSNQYGHLLWHVKGLRHQRRARSVAVNLKRIPGVLEASAALSGVVRIEFDRSQLTERKLRESLAKLDISVADDSSPESGTSPRDDHQSQDHDHNEEIHNHDHAGANDEHTHAHGGFLGKNTELYFAAFCGITLAGGYLFERLASGPSWVPLIGYVAAYFFGGFYTLREAIDNLRMRRFEIDTLMLVAAGGAGALGEWAEGALLLFLFSI